jgi:hypothetical protein
VISDLDLSLMKTAAALTFVLFRARLERRPQRINQLPYYLTTSKTCLEISPACKAQIPTKHQEISCLFDFTPCDLQGP